MDDWHIQVLKRETRWETATDWLRNGPKKLAGRLDRKLASQVSRDTNSLASRASNRLDNELAILVVNEQRRQHRLAGCSGRQRRRNGQPMLCLNKSSPNLSHKTRRSSKPFIQI